MDVLVRLSKSLGHGDEADAAALSGAREAYDATVSAALKAVR